MTVALALVAAWLSTAAPLTEANEAFSSGDFEQALIALDRAAQSAGTSAERVQGLLLRGRCLAALRKYELLEAVFSAALAEDPEARLDPSQVEPTVVAILEGLRSRLGAKVRLDAEPAGAQLEVDGEPVGAAPVELTLPVGPHTVEARWPDGEWRQRTFEARRGAPLAVNVHRGPWWLEARAGWSPPGLAFNASVGGGVSVKFFAVGLALVVARHVGLGVRARFELPLPGRLTPYLAADGELFFASRVVPAAGGALGVRVRATGQLSPFVELGYRHVFDAEFVPDVMLVALGVRWAPL